MLPPGHLNDLNAQGREAWSHTAMAVFAEKVSDRHPQFTTPSALDDEPQVVEAPITWSAFPRKLADVPDKYHLAEERDAQEEYCEWVAEKDPVGRILRVHFTTETGLYFDRLAKDPETLAAVYEQCVGQPVPSSELIVNGTYVPNNPWNLRASVHMIQQFNTFEAAVTLAAQASVVRTNPSTGTLVTNSSELIQCGIIADKERNSDPTIVAKVNEQARKGALITLKDPVGLYLDGLRGASEWEVPSGDATPDQFWTVVRGESGTAVRAIFEVPSDLRYVVSDIKIGGDEITSPSQIAEHVTVRLTGLAKQRDSSQIRSRDCGEEPEGPESLASSSPGSARL